MSAAVGVLNMSGDLVEELSELTVADTPGGGVHGGNDSETGGEPGSTGGAGGASPVEATAEDSEAAPPSGSAKRGDTIVQYIVLRKDLREDLEWPLGAVVSQASHASIAAIWHFRDDPYVKRYVDDMDNMHTVVLGAKNADQLQKVAAKLTAASLDFRLWIEQPENIATAIATKPCEYFSVFCCHFCAMVCLTRCSVIRSLCVRP